MWTKNWGTRNVLLPNSTDPSQHHENWRRDMRWLVFAAMVIVTPVAFGGDLTAARVYLERAQMRRAKANAGKVRPRIKRWPTGRNALIGACFGIAWGAIRSFGSIPETSDQVTRLVGETLGSPIGGAMWFAAVSGTRNWLRGAR